RDRYGRLLAYVWLSPPANGGEDEARDKMLNAMLVRDGWATVLTVPPNVAYVDLFVALQLEARVAQRGLWAGIS
ncbi:MAG TPA: thermonuclease family protein, partial [Actinomycetota bacterium]|nr:thermonuclease family protein [Actinomycetota bacterium]